MDAAAPSVKPRRDSPLIPPNYVSLRDLQELRLKEKEQQERQRRREEDAAVGRVKEEAAAARETETKASSDTSCGAKERPFGGQQWVAVPHRLPPPPPRGEGATKKRDGAIGDRRGMKGSDDAAYNPSRGGGGKAENKGKEKVSAGTKDETREPPKTATSSSHGGKLEEKLKGKGKPSGGQSTPSGTNGGPGEPAEAASASPRGRVTPENKREWKKGSGGRSTETATTCSPADAPPTQGVKSKNKGKKKPSVGRRADAARSSDSLDGKRTQPHPAAEGSRNRKSGGGRGTTTGEAKSEGLGEEQPVVKVKAATERKQRVVRSSAGQRPGGGRGNGAAGQHGGVWVPKAAAAAAPSLSGLAGL